MEKIKSICGKYSGLKDGNTTILFKTELTPELIEEGIYNEIKRFIQKKRKENNLEISDHIDIIFSSDSLNNTKIPIECTNAEFLNIIEKFGTKLKKEVLANRILFAEINQDKIIYFCNITKS